MLVKCYKCRSGRRKNSNRQPVAAFTGFTLLEVLISVALLSVLMTLTYQSFFQLSEHAQKLKQSQSTQEDLQMLLQVLGEDLASAHWLMSFTKVKGRESGIVAERIPLDRTKFSQISMHVNQPARMHRVTPSESGPQLHEVGYFVTKSSLLSSLAGYKKPFERPPDTSTQSIDALEEDTYVLVRREDYYLDDDLQKGGKLVVLMEGIERFEVSFLAEKSAQESKNSIQLTNTTKDNWQDTWHSAKQSAESKLPVAIRIDLALKEKDGQLVEGSLERNVLQPKPPSL